MLAIKYLDKSFADNGDAPAFVCPAVLSNALTMRAKHAKVKSVMDSDIQKSLLLNNYICDVYEMKIINM